MKSFCLFLVLIPLCIFAGYDVQEVGTPDKNAEGIVVNDNGVVLGMYTNPFERPNTFFTWDSIHGVQLVASEFDHIRAFDMNNAGEVVAVGYDSNPNSNPTLFIWRAGEKAQIIDLPYYKIIYVGSLFINNIGQVTGLAVEERPDAIAVFNDGNKVRVPQLPKHQFLWDNTNGVSTIDVDFEGFKYAVNPKGLNDKGQIIFTNYFESAVWANGAIILRPNNVYAINNVGDVITSEAIFGNTVSIINLAGGQDEVNSEHPIELVDINDQKQAVGHEATNFEDTVGGVSYDAKAVIWDSQHGLQDLNKLVDPVLGLSLEEAVSINNRGQILVNGFSADKRPVVLLLTPQSQK